MKHRKFISALLSCLILGILIATVNVFAVEAFKPVICGDVDGNGKVDIRDATAIQMWLVNHNSDSPIGKPIESGYTEETQANEDNVSIDASELAGKVIEFNFIPELESEEVSEGEDYAIIDASELTEEILFHRAEGNTLIVERVISRIGKDGKGRVINTGGIGADTLSFKYSSLPLTEGTLVQSYRIYNPNNNKLDVVNRFDFILSRDFKE